MHPHPPSPPPRKLLKLKSPFYLFITLFLESHKLVGCSLGCTYFILIIESGVGSHCHSYQERKKKKQKKTNKKNPKKNKQKNKQKQKTKTNKNNNKKKQKTNKQNKKKKKKKKRKQIKNNKKTNKQKNQQQTNKLNNETIIDYWGIGYDVYIHHWISILASAFASVNINIL